MDNQYNYKNKAFIGLIIAFALYTSPNILLIIINLYKLDLYPALLAGYHLIISLALILAPLVLLKLSAQKYLIILTPFYCIIPVLLATITIYHKLPSRWMIYMLLNLSVDEFIELTQGMFLWKFLILAVPSVNLIIALKLIPKDYRLNKQIKHRFYPIILGLLIFSYSIKLIQRKTLNNNLIITSKTLIRDTPISTTKRLYKAFKAIITEESSPTVFNKVKASRTVSTNQKEIFILVLGESSRYENWSINGYKRNTSPKLSKRNRLVSYSDVISPSFSTLQSIPIIASTLSTTEHNNQNKQTTIIDVFKQAGFKTYWLSNQINQGNIIAAIAQTADKQIQLNCYKNKCYDTDLLVSLDSILLKNEKKILIILHTLGSHYPYWERYPKSFTYFLPSSVKNKPMSFSKSNQQKTINSYDNSIRFTDHFISELIDRINTDTISSCLIYTSDHGENLYNSSNAGFGRSYGNLSPQLFHVPLFIWASKNFVKYNRDKWAILEKNKTKSISTENIIYSLADMANITWNTANSAKSICNQHFEESVRYFFNKQGLVNYDEWVLLKE